LRAAFKYTVVEVAIESGVPDILDFVVTADYMAFAGGSIRRLQNISRRAGDHPLPGFMEQ
jgi:hypothetical protein